MALVWASFLYRRTSSRLQRLAGSLATQLTGYPVVPSQHLRFVLVHAKVFRRSVLLFDCVGVVFTKASSLSDKVQS